MAIAVIRVMADNEYPYDPEDDDYEPGHEEWISLGFDVWLIRYTFPDGTAEVQDAKHHPGGGFEINL
jgi:hypothetical protein